MEKKITGICNILIKMLNEACYNFFLFSFLPIFPLDKNCVFTLEIFIAKLKNAIFLQNIFIQIASNAIIVLQPYNLVVLRNMYVYM